MLFTLYITDVRDYSCNWCGESCPEYNAYFTKIGTNRCLKHFGCIWMASYRGAWNVVQCLFYPLQYEDDVVQMLC